MESQLFVKSFSSTVVSLNIAHDLFSLSVLLPDGVVDRSTLLYWFSAIVSSDVCSNSKYIPLGVNFQIVKSAEGMYFNNFYLFEKLRKICFCIEVVEWEGLALPGFCHCFVLRVGCCFFKFIFYEDMGDPGISCRHLRIIMF